MIKVEELRIGNFVYGKYQNIITVESINGRGINLVGGDGNGVYPDYEFEEIESIPTTKEWLMGLCFDENGSTWLSPEHNGYRMRVRRDENGFFFLLNEFQRIELPSIHRLQNLYFAIYEKELIKE